MPLCIIVTCIIFVIFPKGPFIPMIVNCNRNIVDIQYEFGEEVVLMGAGLFSLQTKLSDEAV